MQLVELEPSTYSRPRCSIWDGKEIVLSQFMHGTRGRFFEQLKDQTLQRSRFKNSSISLNVHPMILNFFLGLTYLQSHEFSNIYLF